MRWLGWSGKGPDPRDMAAPTSPISRRPFSHTDTLFNLVAWSVQRRGVLSLDLFCQIPYFYAAFQCRPILSSTKGQRYLGGGIDSLNFKALTITDGKQKLTNGPIVPQPNLPNCALMHQYYACWKLFIPRRQLSPLPFPSTFAFSSMAANERGHCLC